MRVVVERGQAPCRECSLYRNSGRHQPLPECERLLGQPCPAPEEHHRFRPDRHVFIRVRT